MKRPSRISDTIAQAFIPEGPAVWRNYIALILET